MGEQLESAYAAFAERVVKLHRLCYFETHAWTCYDEAFRAGWSARETPSEAENERLRAALEEIKLLINNQEDAVAVEAIYRLAERALVG